MGFRWSGVQIPPARPNKPRRCIRSSSFQLFQLVTQAAALSRKILYAHYSRRNSLPDGLRKRLVALAHWVCIPDNVVELETAYPITGVVLACVLPAAQSS